MHPNEAARLRALYDLHLLGAGTEPGLDAICRTARALFGVPIALVSLVDDHKQWFKGRCGLAADGTAREVSFCTYAILSDDVFAVEDAHLDARFAASPLVSGPPHIRFYAGAPLLLEPGLPVGSLCLIDRVSRTLSGEERHQLQDLAQLAVSQLRSLRSNGDARRREASHERLLATTQDAFIGMAEDGTVIAWNRAAKAVFGWSEEEVIGRVLSDLVVPQRFRAAHEQGLQRYLRTGRSAVLGQKRLELVALRRDGTEFPIEMAISVDASGAEPVFNAFLRDITERRQREEALAAGEARYRLLAENTTDMIVRADLGGTRHYVSPASRALFGYEPAELVGTRAIDFVHPDDVAQVHRAKRSITSGEVSRAVCDHRSRHRDGSWVWVETCYSLTYDPHTGEPDGYVAAVRDARARRAAEDELRRSEERLALALESGGDGIWDWNIETGGLWYTDQVPGLLGSRRGEVGISMETWSEFIHADDRAEATARFRDHLLGHTPVYECEYRLRRGDGSYAWISVRGRVTHRDTNGRATRVVGTLIDVTQRKETEQRIAHLARHDPLTDLANRALFGECVEQRLSEIRRNGGRCALLWGDLDRFKAVNDTLGHHVGDLVLVEVARRLRSVLRAEDVVARLGGDEFAFLQVGAGDPAAGAAALARRLIEAVGKPIEVNGQMIEVGLSLGIAVAPEDGLCGEAVLKRADLALYRAKAEGRNTFRYYEAAMDEAVEAKRRLEMDLRGALGRAEFELHYQPVVRAASGEVCGAEALLRWRHPTRGLVPPDVFIPLAEGTGLITEIGAWVLRTATREAAGWPEHLRVAVNLSAVQVRQASLVEVVLGALAASSLSPHRLELEITESVLMQDGAEVVATLERLRGLGVHTALDDFGTGFSSLSYLRRFPFSRLKIDRSFVSDLTNPDTARIVASIINLGRGLGMMITAEGVETGAELARLRDEGCDEVQGYLFSKPVPAELFRPLLHRQSLAA